MKQTTPAPSAVIKADVMDFLRNRIFLHVAYSGHNNTFYLSGASALETEVALLKKFPGMPFKTESSVVPFTPKQGAKTYYFFKDGSFTHVETVNNVIFECVARDSTNARRKFGNYIQSIISKP